MKDVQKNTNYFYKNKVAENKRKHGRISATKSFCQGLTRKTKRPCQAKGYPTANGKYLCRFHGGNNIKGFNQKNYTDDTRINNSKHSSNSEINKRRSQAILLQRNQT